MRRSYPPNVARFLKAFENHATKLFSVNPKNRNADVERRVSEQIFAPWTHEQTKPLESKQNTFLRDYFNEFREVQLACEQFDTLRELIRNTISEEEKYHLPTILIYWSESYLNEVYVFEQRIRDFLTATERRYKQDPDFGKPAKAVCTEIRKMIDEQLASVRKVRGSHVHQTRLRHSDPQLVRLANLELLVTGLGDLSLAEERKKAIEEAKIWLLQQVDYFTESSWTILDATCAVLADGIVTENDWLIVPTNYKD
jgi:hypothetical protein